ncbi:MAG: hypothetical protein U0V74_00770 [Chitinophagales bacterium]
MEAEKYISEQFELNEQLLPQNQQGDERFKAFRQLLIERIGELILKDFDKLKWILYRIDVSEKKLTEALKNTEADPAEIIADHIIQRQIEKAKSRKKYGSGESDWSFDV